MKHLYYCKSLRFLLSGILVFRSLLVDSLHQAEASRRAFLTTSTATTAVTVLSKPSLAATPLSAGEAIRQGAANLPGYGPPDIFFPEAVRGTWKMTRLVQFPNSQKRLELQYPIRFIPSVRDQEVVADRGINQAELEKALRRSITGEDDQTISYDWSMSNPNDLRLTWKTGTKEIKVTKRATESNIEERGTLVTSSEFQRIVTTMQQEDGRAIPSISARRVLTKWIIINPDQIEGTEIIYDIPTAGDPMAAGKSGGTSSTPTVLSKSQFFLIR